MKSDVDEMNLNIWLILRNEKMKSHAKFSKSNKTWLAWRNNCIPAMYVMSMHTNLKMLYSENYIMFTNVHLSLNWRHRDYQFVSPLELRVITSGEVNSSLSNQYLINAPKIISNITIEFDSKNNLQSKYRKALTLN